jgi:hypothetical protein
VQYYTVAAPALDLNEDHPLLLKETRFLADNTAEAAVDLPEGQDSQSVSRTVTER